MSILSRLIGTTEPSYLVLFILLVVGPLLCGVALGTLIVRAIE